MCPDGENCRAKRWTEDGGEDCGGFLCAVCDSVWCCADGASDDMPEACDHCWCKAQHDGAGEVTP